MGKMILVKLTISGSLKKWKQKILERFRKLRNLPCPVCNSLFKIEYSSVHYPIFALNLIKLSDKRIKEHLKTANGRVLPYSCLVAMRAVVP